MYCLVPEKPLRLVYGTFYLAIGNNLYDAIGDTFYEFIRIKPAKEITFKMKPYTIVLTILSILFSSAAFAERLAVSSVTANIRSGPGTNHDILWKVEKYYPI
ncbi:MAG: hypothetical protein JRI92_12225, partial [Deltaproteobacteria bacterium]|nr:hypothetical protein [Deltaproteobacteria bacterium]